MKINMRWWSKIAATFTAIWGFENAMSTYNSYGTQVLTNYYFWLLILLRIVPAIVVFIPLCYYGFRKEKQI